MESSAEVINQLFIKIMKTRTLMLALMLVMTSSHVMAQGRQNKEKQVEKTVMNNILTRTSVRRYQDKAVEAYPQGELVNTGANGDHHGEGHSCGHHGDEGGCGHHDGEDCGGCHEKPSIEGVNVGKTCRTHYRGTFNDGTQFDSSYDRGEPLEFVCGAGMMIKGFDAAVANMKVGETVTVHLMPEEAYGQPDPRAFLTVPIARMPGTEKLEVGQQVYLQNMQGEPFPVRVSAKDAETITFDANHEMAGKELNFTIELVEVK